MLCRRQRCFQNVHEERFVEGKAGLGGCRKAGFSDHHGAYTMRCWSWTLIFAILIVVQLTNWTWYQELTKLTCRVPVVSTANKRSYEYRAISRRHQAAKFRSFGFEMTKTSLRISSYERHRSCLKRETISRKFWMLTPSDLRSLGVLCGRRIETVKITPSLHRLRFELRRFRQVQHGP